MRKQITKDIAIMRLFKAYISNQPKKSNSFDEEALKKGICIDKECPQEIIALAIQLWGKDGYLLNQTFHKSFKVITETEEETLMLQQILHYFSTYGKMLNEDYNKDLIYIPKEKLELPNFKNDLNLIKISTITSEELSKRLWTLCASSIALSKDTIEAIKELSAYLNVTEANINEIRNKEVKILLINKLGLLPGEPEEFMRYLIFRQTGSTLVIKNTELINQLKFSNKQSALESLENYSKKYGLEKLSQVFNRYKPLFLALKIPLRENATRKLYEHEKKLNAIINKISHLSKKYHKPMIKNDLDIFVDWCFEHENDFDFKNQLEEKINKAGIWRAIKLKNYLEYKKINSNARVYKIRNGKSWIRTEYVDNKYNPAVALDILDSIITDNLKRKVNGKKIYFDDITTLVLPQSEKQFVENIPFGSNILLNKENLIIGIKWYDVENKRVDIDLKILSNEYEIGWDKEYRVDDKLIYSGDITAAPYPDGATEYIYIDKEIGPTVFSLKINNYTRYVDNVEYDLIIAKGYKEKLNQNYIIDTKDIILKIPNNKLEQGKAEHSLGTIIVDDKNIKLIFTDLCTSNRNVSFNNNLEESFRKYIIEETSTKCHLKDYLQKAGAIITNNSNEADYDFSIEKLNKDTIINLLS